MNDVKQKMISGDFEGALNALQAHPQDVNTLTLKAQALAALSRFDEAAQAASAILHIDNTNLNGHNLVGAIYLATGQPTAALPHLDYGLSQDPNHLKMLNNRAMVYIETGEPDRALPDVERLGALAQQGLATAGQLLLSLKEKLDGLSTSVEAASAMDALEEVMDLLITNCRDGSLSPSKLGKLYEAKAMELYAMTREQYQNDPDVKHLEHAAAVVNVISEELLRKKTLGIFAKKKLSAAEVEGYVEQLKRLKQAKAEDDFMARMMQHAVTE